VYYIVCVALCSVFCLSVVCNAVCVFLCIASHFVVLLLLEKNPYSIQLNNYSKETVTGFETSRLPRFLDSRLTDGGKVISLTHRPPFTLRKIPGTNFC
jgi:hypothetical protein